MKSFEVFYPYILPEVIGCPDPVVDQAISRTLVDFCEKSLILQRDHDPITVIAGVQDYDFAPPRNYLVHKVMKAWYKTHELKPLTPDQMSDPFAYRSSIAGEEANKTEPYWLYQKDERTFSLLPWPVETVTEAVTMRVALKPSRSATTVDDVIYEDWLEAIVAGSLAHLQISPGKPYTVPNSAVLNQQLYMQKLNEARQKAIRGHVRGNQQIKIRRI